jgi:hypothetical protein
MSDATAEDTAEDIAEDMKGLAGISYLPTFDSIEEERRHRKERLAAGFRLFDGSGSTRAWPATSPRATLSSSITSG